MFLKKYGVFLLICFLAWKAFLNYKTIGPDNQVLRADGKGYYAYLPAVFIYHDNQMTFIDYYEHAYNPPAAYAEFRNQYQGKFVDKYFAGVAILQLPFFLVAHVASLLWHKPTDGYAPLYQHFFVIGGLFYLFLGLTFFLKLLLAWGIKAWQALSVITVLVLGTNLYHYAVYEQCMSHVYSLSMMLVFLYSIHQVCHSRLPIWIIMALFTLGMIIILRPVNIIVVGIVPFISGSWQNLKSALAFILKDYKVLIAGIICGAMPFLIQALLWHWQTGDFFVYSYGQEKMEWANPKMWHILFDFRKGWFIWTPMACIGICGFIFIAKNLYRFITLSLFTFLLIYVLSCWWTADYGSGFGARVFIEFLFLPCFGLAFVFQKTGYFLARTALLLICFFGIYINQVQEMQYRYHIILWDGMDKASYWRVFLQQSPGYYYWLDERSGFKPVILTNKIIDKSFTNDFEHPLGWKNEEYLDSILVHSGKYSNCINYLHRQSAIFSHPLTENEIQNDSFIQASVWFYGPQPDVASLVIAIENKNKVITKIDSRIRKFADYNYSWNKATLQLKMPENVKIGDTVKVYVDEDYNYDTFYIDDFRVDLVKK